MKIRRNMFKEGFHPAVDRIGVLNLMKVIKDQQYIFPMKGCFI
ncbi:Uncharacterised protein [Mycobacteroides abscessus subsp. abscessus]|nr:Uncharacterised protein [Mycobacteroides abscessus subsp. abscessus]